MTAAELKNYFRAQLVATRSIAQEFNVLDAIVDFIAQALTTGIPTWAAELTFQTDGSGSGAYTIYADSNGKIRFWKTKVDDNTGNAPPTNPATTENTWWIEISPADSSAIKEWQAGIYGPGLVIVYFDVNGDGTDPALYILLEPTRPFESTNFVTELAANKWKKMSGSDTGGGPAIAGVYADIAALIADQGNQEENAYYWVTDASTDPTVDSGWAIYRKLAASTADLSDYVKVQEQEGLDILAGVQSVTGEGVDNTDPANPVIKLIGGSGTFTGEVDLTSQLGKVYSTLTQTGDINLTLAASPVLGGFARVKIVANGDAINIPANWKNLGDDLNLSVGITNEILFCYFGPSDVRYAVKTYVDDATAPTIDDANMEATSIYVDVTFSEGVYNSVYANGPIEASDLNLDFDQNGGTATNVTISSVKKPDSGVEGSASALTGGESVVRVFLSITGTHDGNETIEITPVDATSIYDSSGNAMADSETTGIVNLLTSGSFANDYSGSFNGTSSYVSMPSTSDLEFNNAGTDVAFTICGWVKPSSVDRFRIAFMGTLSSGVSYLVGTTSTNKWSIIIYDANTSNKIQRNSVADAQINTWQHVSFSYDGSGSVSGLKIYVDGVEQSYTDGSAGTFVAMELHGVTQIGRSENDARYAQGLIDELCFFKGVAFSGSEVTEAYNSGTPFDMTTHSQAANLSAYVRLENNVNDSSGNAHHGTNNNVTFSSDVP